MARLVDAIERQGLPAPPEPGIERSSSGIGTIQFQTFFWQEANRLLQPHKGLHVSEYFLNRWCPRLGPKYTALILCLRVRAQHTPGATLSATHEELAAAMGIASRSLRRLLEPQAFDDRPELRRFIRITSSYRYDPKKRKKVRGPNIYAIALDDPLLPEDEAELTEAAFGPPDGQNGRQDEPAPSGQNGRQVTTPPDGQSGRQVQPPETITETGSTAPASGQNGRARSSSSRSLKDQTTTSRLPDETLRRRVRELIPSLQTAALEALIASVGGDEIARQLAAFPMRDTSWAQNGPAAAFVHYCRVREPCPPLMTLAEEQRSLAARVLTQFPELAPSVLERLIVEVGADEVERQLAAIDARDTRWAVNGPAAAFVHYCRERIPVPVLEAEAPADAPDPVPASDQKAAEEHAEAASELENAMERSGFADAWRRWLAALPAAARRVLGNWLRLELTTSSTLRVRYPADLAFVVQHWRPHLEAAVEPAFGRRLDIDLRSH